MLGRRLATGVASVGLALSGALSAQASVVPSIGGALTSESSAIAMAVTTTALNPGATMRPGDELRSASGKYSFVLQSDGNAVIYGPKGALWATGKRGARLTMQSDGNLVLYPATGPASWHSGTAGSAGARLVLGDDGSLTVVSPNGAVRWGTPADPAVLGDRLLPGQVLAAGQSLTGKGGAVLALQKDGNLVRYEDGQATWSTSTFGSNARLVLLTDGNLVLSTAERGAAWTTRTGGHGGSMLLLQKDGNLVLYAGAVALWAVGVTPEEAAEQRIVDLVNIERAKVGCQPVQEDPRLAKAAELHSEDMRARGYFSHTSPEGSTLSSRAAAQGYPASAMGENIANGYQTPDSVMGAWMNSTGHRENIQRCSYQSIGVGSATGGRHAFYWTQVFGTR